jgi:signal transduction histidine kinase
MTDHLLARPSAWRQRAVQGIAGAVILVGALALVGWAFRLDRLVSELYAPARWQLGLALLLVCVVTAGGVALIRARVGPTVTRLEQRVRERTADLERAGARLSILHEIDRGLIAAQSPVGIAEGTLRQLRDLLGVPRVIVNLFDLEAGQVEWLAAAGRHRVHVGPGVQFPLALMGNLEALQRGEPQVIDVAALPPSAEAEALLKSGVHVYMVMPMIAGGTLLGGLSFGGVAREFSPDQIAIAEEVARQMAIVVEHSRLLERITRNAAELEARVRTRTAELEAAQAELVGKERLATLGQLAGSVAHELRNPLGVIKNAVYFLRLALSATEDVRVRKHLAILEREVATSNRIISDLLDFARRPTPTRVPISLNDVVRECLDRLEAPEGHVERVVRLAEDLPRLDADPFQFDQILGNLIRNALQAMPEGGRLTIETAQQADGSLTLAVADTGAGIPPETLTRIFEPLFTTKAKGVGLGLAIVRQLTEANGGVVEVASTPGQGTRFTLRFPRVPA